ncbi:MAG: VOC family protein [Deltaproteobacteria bacterium]|nr:VOC family protein [Deltaproteobacteria bacterium]
MRPIGAHHVAIKARDVERVAGFYRDLLGLAEKRRNYYSESDRLRSVWLACEPVVLMIEQAEADGEAEEPASAPRWDAPDRPGLHLLALRIRAQDAPRWREHLGAHGHPVVHATAHTLYVLDPEGNRVGLSSLSF